MSTPKLTLSSPTLPPSSLILVTGCNGLIATHAADQLLAAGYHVRGAVRSLTASGYLTPLFTARHGPGRFTLVETPDLTVPGAWDAAVRGVAGIAHVVGAVDTQVQDAEAAAAAELPWQIRLLEAARREGVRSVVVTASAWGAWTPDPSKKVVLTEESWNDEAVALARDASVDAGAKGMAGFMALKTLVERGLWEWVRKEEPEFAFNTLLLDTVIGECLDPKNQGIPSTAGMVHWVWQNKLVEVLNMVKPQWFIDCRDAGRLYVALLASSPQVDRQRIYGFGERYSWVKVAEILSNLHPEHASQMAKPKDNGWDQTEVPNQKAEELLRRLGQQGWTSLEKSVEENAKSWLKLGDAEIPEHIYSKLGK
ncbi:hypothetical protein B0T25DRAFT_514474 [Lasiosphaeria hispida]|uniref:NAD-dependent epimerase/dehydratase domain-containing protein n=1 Tax=Lasiosphaeria hispida TaxID=260671 RepID=A0AAJ0HP20_9PEZI|nr:hypothetical protein B0T25DRAFT_514474 [Lasiosphaeria hispida]